MKMVDPVRLRSAIIIVETETGETMQMALTPEYWQPVEVQVEMESEVEVRSLAGRTIASQPVWTVTLVAGGYHGQWRATQHRAAQAGPEALEG